MPGGTAETIDTGRLRAELTADALAWLSNVERPHPASIIGMLDEQQRAGLRITSAHVTFHE